MVLLLAGFAVPTARAGDLADLLGELYGGDGITLAPTGHQAHFTGESLVELNTFSEDLTSALGGFAANSTVSSYTFDLELGVPVRTSDSLGPIVSERATTIGGRRVNVGFSYNRIDYKHFEGDDLNDITLYFNHQDANGDGVIGPNPATDVEVDRVRINLDVNLGQDVYAIYGTLGIFDNLDLSLSIPIVTVDLEGKALASIDRKAVRVTDMNGDLVDCPGEVDEDGNPVPPGASECVHQFAEPPEPGDPEASSVKGHSSGIGDILLRGKYHFLSAEERWRPNLAFVGQVRFPSGNQDELLGTGDWRGMMMLVADHTYGRFSPHLNLGYEIVGGNHTLSNFRYIAGFDARVHPRATAVIDLLGRWEPEGDGIGDNLIDAAIGGKFNAWRSLVLVANFIVPLNRNVGLRPDFVWALGVEYTFGGPG